MIYTAGEKEKLSRVRIVKKGFTMRGKKVIGKFLSNEGEILLHIARKVMTDISREKY